MGDEKLFMLKFKGRKKEIHTYFKMICIKYGIDMNDKFVELADEWVKENKKNL